MSAGIQLAGRFGEDPLHFRFAAQLELARFWFSRWPALPPELPG